MYAGHFPDADGFYWYYIVCMLIAPSVTTYMSVLRFIRDEWPLQADTVDKLSNRILALAVSEKQTPYTACIITNVIPVRPLVDRSKVIHP